MIKIKIIPLCILIGATSTLAINAGIIDYTGLSSSYKEGIPTIHDTTNNTPYWKLIGFYELNFGSTDEFYQYALYYLFDKEDSESFITLCKHNIEKINYPFKWRNQSLLLLAIKASYKNSDIDEAVKFLVNDRADITHKDKQGFNAIKSCILFRKVELLEFLLDKAKNQLTKEEFNLLLNPTISQNSKVNGSQKSPLQIAIEKDLKHIALLLIKNGADPYAIGTLGITLKAQASPEIRAAIEEFETQRSEELRFQSSEPAFTYNLNPDDDTETPNLLETIDSIHQAIIPPHTIL